MMTLLQTGSNSLMDRDVSSLVDGGNDSDDSDETHVAEECFLHHWGTVAEVMPSQGRDLVAPNRCARRMPSSDPR